MAPADFTVNYLLSSFFDTVVLAVLDRCHLAMDVVERVPGLGARAAQSNSSFAIS
jgi:hypothetical protein